MPLKPPATKLRRKINRGNATLPSVLSPTLVRSLKGPDSSDSFGADRHYAGGPPPAPRASDTEHQLGGLTAKVPKKKRPSKKTRSSGVKMLEVTPRELQQIHLEPSGPVDFGRVCEVRQGNGIVLKRSRLV